MDDKSNLAEPSRPANRRVKLTEIAAELGVATSTVSNAYNRPDQLSPDLRQKILEVAARLGYAGPDPAARRLRRGRAGTLGVLYTNRLSYAFSDPAAVLFLQGLARATEEAGLGLLLIPNGLEDAHNRNAVAEAVVDGFVIFSMADDDPLVTAALERRLPTIMVDQPILTELPFVGIDDLGGTYQAARHVIQQGHQALGVITFRLANDSYEGWADINRQTASTFHVSRARLQGYAQACAEAGLNWGNVPVYECPEGSVEKGAQAARALLNCVPRPTALLTFSDQLALGALEATRALSLNVPQDVAIVGFDDIAAAALTTPALTTVHQPHLAKGLLAGRQLIQLLAPADKLPIPTPQILPTELVIRASSLPL